MKTLRTKLNKKWLKLVIILVLVLICLRATAPFAVKHLVNNALANQTSITGHIGDVDLHLYRGAYEIENIEIYSIDINQNKHPFIVMDKLDISVLWSPLLRGQIVSKMTMYRLDLSIHDTEPEPISNKTDVAKSKTWVDLANDLTPFSIDEIVLYDSKITLKTSNESAIKTTYIDEIYGLVTNITNKSKGQSLHGSIELTGKLMGQSNINVQAKFDPFATRPNFDVNLSVEKFSISYLDNVIKFYSPFDVEGGIVDGAMELASVNGVVAGYVKLGVYQLDVFTWKNDVMQDGDNPFIVLAENITELLGNILENDKNKTVATHVPIKGTLEHTQISTFAALLSMIENAFVEAIDLNLEQIVSYQTLKKENKESN